MTHEIIIYNSYVSFEIGNVSSITFLSERSVLCFLFSEDDNLCLSDWSELLFLSFQLVKDEKSRPSCLACWFWYRRIALSDLYGSKFWAELWKKLLQCFFHWIRPHWGIEFYVSRWNINMVAFSDRVIWLTKWSFHNVFLFSLSSVFWQAAQKIVAYLTMFDCYISPSRWLDYVCFA